jgi:2-polyprenyl-6-methoxyphenol hydroxylase-like FAD-dependent oxidoreductase
MTTEEGRGTHVTGVEHVEVLIVGAGPTGLTLAAQLQRFGVRVRIVDRLASRVQESRALAIQPRSLEVLATLGIARTLVERGNDAVDVKLHAGGRVVSFRLFDVGLHDTAYPFLLFLSQAETERALNAHLSERGVRVERGVELTGFTATDDAVTCRLRHHDGSMEAMTVRWLVGCDGAHSTVRHGAAIDFEGGAYPPAFLLADVEVDGDLEPGHVHVYMGAPGALFFFPLKHPATWRVQSMLPSRKGDGDAGDASEAVSIDVVQSVVDAFTGGALRLRGPAWLTRFRIHHRHAATYRAGRVFLAGDAAHVHSPAGAQGMNTGIQDAWNLGWKLAYAARASAESVLLDSYEAERRPVGRAVLRLSDRPFVVATSQHWLFRFIRTHMVPRVLPLALRFTRGRAYVYRRLAQLEIRYRTSAIAREGVPRLRSGPKAGDRLPDMELVRDGRPLRLHQALADPSFHLLLCGSPAAWPEQQVSALREQFGKLLTVHHLTRDPTPGVLEDPSGDGLARLGVVGAAHYLVRPDGYIAYRARGTDPTELSGLLSRCVHP